ncbi:MAG TPA: acyl-CoA reductase [Bacteroidales bacterium]|nr:acyl-CoA reductase [Bacteroidales bacterium]
MTDTAELINTDEHIQNFCKISAYLADFVYKRPAADDHVMIVLKDAAGKSMIHNGFFTEQNILSALKALSTMLEKEKLEKWVCFYKSQLETNRNPARVAVVMAGNIPLVGFHDFLCVLFSGNIFIGKLSQQDQFLLPAIAEILFETDPRYRQLIHFTRETLPGFDVVIATGSNNTSRYFEYYFGKYPHIIRKNRNSIAVLTGDETDEQLKRLAEDIFSYFGLGCRNISKIFFHTSCNIGKFINLMQPYAWIADNNKYKNNYDYYKAIFLLDNRIITDGGFFILLEEKSLYSPVSVINYEKYSDIGTVENFINEHAVDIQCVVGATPSIPDMVGFGKAQHPELFDYADNIDTMKFLLKL